MRKKGNLSQCGTRQCHFLRTRILRTACKVRLSLISVGPEPAHVSFGTEHKYKYCFCPFITDQWFHTNVNENRPQITCPYILPALPRISSKLSEFFFCGMRLLPVLYASDNVTKLNSLDEYRMRSSAQRLRWTLHNDAQNRNSAKTHKCSYYFHTIQSTDKLFSCLLGFISVAQYDHAKDPAMR